MFMFLFFFLRLSHETHRRPFISQTNFQNNMATGECSVGAKKGVQCGDTRKLMKIDRIVAWAFWIAKSLKPGTISRSWVAKFIKRDESFVKRNWRNSPYEIEEEKEQKALSQESKDIIREIT